MIRRTGETRTLNTETGSQEMVIDDILWIESSGVRENSPCCLHTDRGRILCQENFEKVLPILGSAFLTCLPRGAVNQRRIRAFVGQSIELDNGETMTVEPFLAARYRDAYCRNLAKWVWEG